MQMVRCSCDANTLTFYTNVFCVLCLVHGVFVSVIYAFDKRVYDIIQLTKANYTLCSIKNELHKNTDETKKKTNTTHYIIIIYLGRAMTETTLLYTLLFRIYAA